MSGEVTAPPGSRNPLRNPAAPVDAAIAIPCIAPNALVRKCVTECRKQCPGAEIYVVADRAEAGEDIAGAELVVTGFITMSAKRNLVARRSTRTYLGLIDSDAYPAPGWMQNAIRVLERRPEVWMVGGPNISPPDEPAVERCVGAAQRSFLVTGAYAFRKTPGARARDVDDLPSCNMVLRRADFLALGGMREDLYIYEDKEMCTKVIAAGRCVHFSPDVTVFHKDRSLRLFLFQRLAWGASLWRGLRASGFKVYLLLPSLMVGFLLSAPLALAVPYWGYLYLAVGGVYLATVAAEGMRHAGSAAEMPATMAAILVGNLGPGLGSWLGPLGLLPDARKIYRNTE
jgi:hypothetical protein